MARKIYAYCYKMHLLYIGWIIVKTPEKAQLYHDDAPTVTITPESDLKYATLGFTANGVLRKLKKQIERKHFYDQD